MRILIALLVVCFGSAFLWASLDRPLEAPDWRGDMRGISYSPSGLYSESQLEKGVPEAVIRQDLEKIATISKRIRTYTVDRGIDRVPYLAKEMGLKVSLGIWLSDDRPLNDIEINKAIKAVNDNPGVIDRIFVGNEVVLRGELTAEELSAYILRVKKAVANKKIEIGTVDVPALWTNNPKMAEESAFIGINLLPYWEGVSADMSMDWVEDYVEQMQAEFPRKKIIITEAGWPSEGRVKRGAVPSPAMAAYFYRHFLNLATVNDYDYYVLEAFDQPFKAEKEGAVGAFWGILDAEANPKFSFTGTLTSFEEWASYAGIAAAGSLIIGMVVLLLIPAVGLQGYLLVSGIVGVVVSGALFIVEASSLRYVDWGTFGGALFIVPAGLFTGLLLITETSEWALSLWRKGRKRLPTGPLAHYPKVSIHVPTHNEPPQMVMQTLNALARLDYPDFEVIVLDNNTKDEADWKPVEAHCATLGDRFRFFHYDNMKGFKAGALNKALELTHPDAAYIGVIDSDYQVMPHWLRTAMPAFTDPKVAIFQGPQDYRDADESLFKSLCYEEYTGFFRIGMVERNEHNAIIQHGTMCVVRRAAMEQVGGWAEWCITEDTELGLRLFEAGYTAHYTSETLGRGLMPDTYEAYKTQRYRWVYGAMQIMKRHAAQIFRGKSKLTLAQRYHFVAGWLPWFADGFALIFGVLAMIWSLLMAVAPKYFDVPLTALSSVALAIFTIKTLKTVLLHRAKVGTGFLGAMASAVTGLSLAFTVGRGVLSGLFTSSKPFMRTPKCENMAPWSHALRITAIETAMLVGTIIAIIGTIHIRRLEDPAERIWVTALVVMAIPYAASLLVALGSTLKFGRRSAGVPQVDHAPAQVYGASKLDPVL
jgi:exo-beta-1,3-glucanase (GH17 family)/cellulose synthase/poly-beta-1,6-N-acetylglucosamine synthase-like glycosyltransferase